MPRHLKNQPGFTLIELLIYLGMSTIVVITVSNFMIDISQSAARTRATLSLQTNSRLIINRITQTVRTSTGALSYPDTHTLVIPMPGGNQTYTLTGTTVVETLPSGTSDTLNSADAAVKAFTVTDQTIGASVLLTLGTSASANPAVPDYTVSSTIVRRQPLYQ